MTKTMIPAELKYTKTHEWVRVEKDNSVTIGITDHAQKILGDFVYVELPEVGKTFAQGAECAVVESVKAASDVFCPLAGEVTSANVVLVSMPDLLNRDPYGEGWVLCLQLSDPKGLDELLDAEGYEKYVASEK